MSPKKCPRKVTQKEDISWTLLSTRCRQKCPRDVTPFVHEMSPIMSTKCLPPVSNRQTNAMNKWIRKENWLVQIGCKNIWTWNWAKVPLECNWHPSCKCKMVMPVQNYNFVCSCIRILTWHCNESWIELLNNNSHGLSPPGGLVSPSGGFVSLLCDQGLHFASILLCQASCSD